MISPIMISPMIPPMDFLGFSKIFKIHPKFPVTSRHVTVDSSCNRTRLRRRTREDLRKVPRWGPTELSLGAIASSRRALSIDTLKKLHKLSSETLWRGRLVVAANICNVLSRRAMICIFFKFWKNCYSTRTKRSKNSTVDPDFSRSRGL